ncbi:type-4 uracil-DNA glycosylase [Sulfuracidifex tepidarius]|uniref:Type-4 uracil-DNA glycosylase n=1 Tax=Sulfuracidifex tepidarius TaxID=1294262 RepID=A0A510DZK5_9CREN|nr:type-4 uracil-DNA glycosylase [Sulfuracidifex tepidarius]BBG25370.1 hypothetical protein IC006_2705 [Sulfuracidifex tepidarius]BBG28164.1 hypothetical protein IC007_2719 [Sulfuracidifex tepidarius]
MSSLSDLEIEIRACKKCKLFEARKNAVPGEGNPHAKLMFIGEAPGLNEDIQGRPFVGAAGKLLDKMIHDVLGLERKDVFITNVVKCRPPNNRDPMPEEISACSPYLVSQIRLINPQLIVTLGRHSTGFLFTYSGVDFPGITKVRGKPHTLRIGRLEIKVFPTYHPAAALYNPNLRETIRDDFVRIRSEINSNSYTIDQFFDPDGSSNKR